jgi:hypothetical protein
MMSFTITHTISATLAVAKKEGKKICSKGGTTTCLLVLAHLSVTGTGQKSSTFWDRVCTHYNNY